MNLHFGIISLFIFGDSKVIVDWFNGEVNLNVLILQDWKNRILSLRTNFSLVKYFHIHREYNTQADSLSKQGLSGQLGLLQVEEFDEDSLIYAFSISLFWKSIALWPHIKKIVIKLWSMFYYTCCFGQLVRIFYLRIFSM